MLAQDLGKKIRVMCTDKSTNNIAVSKKKAVDQKKKGATDP